MEWSGRLQLGCENGLERFGSGCEWTIHLGSGICSAKPLLTKIAKINFECLDHCAVVYAHVCLCTFVRK